MTIDRAIEILDPEHRECYDGMDEVNEACRMGMEALERTRWVPCSERLPDLKPQKAGIGLDYTYSDVVYVWTTGGKAMTGIWDGITWIAPFPFWDAWEERITHWKPIYPPKVSRKVTDCFNYLCLCRGGNESKPPYKCECVACPNRVTGSHIIMSNRTLVQEEIKYLTKNGGIGNE